MKKLLLIIPAILAVAALPLFASNTGKLTHAAATPSAQKYTCTMHPEIIRHKPGNCPKCHMKLVPVDEAKKDETKK